MIWRLNTNYEADKGGSGAGDNPPAQPPAAPPATPPTPPANDAAPPADNRISMTTAQLEERLERAKGVERTGLAKALGFESVEALQAAVDAGKAALAAQKTEAERQAEALKAAQQRADEAAAQVAQAQRERDQAHLLAEALRKMAGKFQDPDAAFKLLDQSQVKIVDGKVTGLDEAITAAEQKYPWALAQPAKKTMTPPTTAPNPDGNPPAGESDEDKRQRYFGGGRATGFFGGGGVKAPVEKK